MGIVDLHTHTTASDGVLTPGELVELALQRGMRVLAITDHDSTEGVALAQQRASGTPLEVWAGIEVSTDVPGAEIHILGYFIDLEYRLLQGSLRELRDSRLDRAQRMVGKLAELGMPLDIERVRQLAGTGSVGRPHVAQALVEHGYVENAREAFDRYIGRTGPAYVDRYKLTPAEAIRLIREAGGIASLAHPIYIGAAAETGEQFSLDHVLPELLEAGLGGIEAYYPAYDSAIADYLVGLCARHGLISTGGSDFHGGYSISSELGCVDVPWETVERLRAWREAQQR